MDNNIHGVSHIGGISVLYELQGSDPTPVEMDDERSRRGLGLGLSPLSPRALSPRAITLPDKRWGSRASSLGPVSDTL